MIDKLINNLFSIGTIQRQSIISFTSQILITIIGFFSTIYFARSLGASILGEYFLLLTYYSIIAMISDGGFGMATIKRISEGDEQDEYLSAFFIVRITFTIIVIILLILFRQYLFVLNNTKLFEWLILLLSITGFTGYISTGISGSRKFGIIHVSNFLSELSKTIIQIIAVFLGYGIAGMIGGFITLLVINAILQKHFLDLRLVIFKWRHVKNLSSLSFWLFLTSSGTLLYSYSDTVIISHYLHISDVGIYRVILQFSAVSSFIAGSINSILWPNISRWEKIKDNRLIEDSLSRAISFSLLLAIPIFIGGLLLGDKLLYYFYGSTFSTDTGYKVLIIMLIIQIIGIFQLFYLNYLGALNRQKYAFKVTSISAIINIILNIVLIPKIGIIGATIATLVTMTLNVYLARILLSKLINIRIEYDIILNIIKSSIIMSIFVILYRLFIPLDNITYTIIPVLLGGTIYGFLISRLDNKIYSEIKRIVDQICS